MASIKSEKDVLLKGLNCRRILVVADPVRRFGIVNLLDELIDFLVELCTMADNVERRECEPPRTSEIMTKKLDDWMQKLERGIFTRFGSIVRNIDGSC